jgi:hypothetical protein
MINSTGYPWFRGWVACMHGGSADRELSNSPDRTLSLSHSTPEMPCTPRRFDRAHADDASRRATLWVMWGVAIIACEFSACACDDTTLLVGALITTTVIHVTALATTTQISTNAAAVAITTVTRPVVAWTAPSTTTTTHSTQPQSCDGVERCLQDTHCAQCIDAINSTAGFPHTLAEYGNVDRAPYDVMLFGTLLSTPSCSTNATLPYILHTALQELDLSKCKLAFGMFTSPCTRAL